MVDRIGTDVASTQSERSTVFHAYCESGVWPAAISQLPQRDIDTIKSWHVPVEFGYIYDDTVHKLSYQNAMKETRVALGWDFESVDVPSDVPQDKIAELYPNVMTCGHLDMAWLIPDRDLVIICDIKSSIFAVRDRCESLQLHGYGIAAARKFGVNRYVTAIWDAQNGEYLVRPGPAIELDGFEVLDVMDRIKLACADRPPEYITGEHCSGCWKRFSCKAHLVEGVEGDFAPLLDGTATEADVRKAIVKLKQIGDLKEKVESATKDWVRLNGCVRSEDGKKVYRAAMRDGRPSTDYKAVARDLGLPDLNKYKTKGGQHEAFLWMNNKG